MALIISKYCERQMLLAARASGVFSSLRLFVNNFIPTPDSVAADFTEATFQGYGMESLSFDDPFTNGDEKGQMNAASRTWVRGVGGPEETVYGWFVLDGSGLFVLAKRLPSPVPMDTPGVSTVYVQLSLTQNEEP